VVENMANSLAAIFWHWKYHLLKIAMNYLQLLLTSHVSKMVIFHLQEVVLFYMYIQLLVIFDEG